MKHLKRFILLSALALLAGFAVAGNASAAQREATQLCLPAAQGPVAAADYFWHGRHYVYVWHGKYFNHRRWRNNVWYYY
jgi:hypothetical protein